MTIRISRTATAAPGSGPDRGRARTMPSRRSARFVWIGALGAVLVATAVPNNLLGAQATTSSHDADTAAVARPEVVSESGVRATTLTKWAALATSLGTAAYGITRQRAADQLYADIERTCVDDPGRCGERRAEGEFADPVLASRYRNALAIDRRARTALIVSQVAVVASVALFLLDLDDRGAPAHDPDDPPLRLELGTGTVGISVRLAVGTPGTSPE